MKVTNKRKRFYIIDSDMIAEWAKIIKPSGLAVYNCLVSYANSKTHSCYPSHNTIAQHLGISRRTVVSITQKLSKLGIITVKKRIKKSGGKASNLYTINYLPDNKCAKDTDSDVQEFHIVCAESAHRDVQNLHINKTKFEQEEINKTTDDNIDSNNISHTRSKLNAKVVEIVEKEKTSSSVNFVKDKEPTDITDEITYPQGLEKSQTILKELSKLPNSEAAQQVLNVYASKDNIRNPVGLIKVLVKNHLADDFTPIDKPKLADDLNFTPIQEKTICPFCNGSNILWTKDSLHTQQRIKCNHNESYILNKLKQDESCIQGTKYDFRIKKEHKPSTGTFWQQLKIHQQNEAKNAVKNEVVKKEIESQDVKPSDSSVIEQFGFKLKSIINTAPVVIPDREELLRQMNARVKLIDEEMERKKKAMIDDLPK